MKITLLFLGLFISQTSFAKSKPAILIFGKTLRPAHVEIIPGAIRSLGIIFKNNGFESVVTQDPNVFSKENLISFDSIVLLDVSEGILNSEQQLAIEKFVDNGKGLLSIHASISAGKDWPWYKQKIGTLFLDHPPIQKGVIRIVNPNHYSTDMNDKTWAQADEWYNFTEPLNSNHKVLAEIDESTYQGGKMGERHPISWCHEVGEARVWFTAMGHDESLYANTSSVFAKHLLGAAKWVSHLDK
jgi:type 1 glutamine amidotransferase